MAKVHTGRRFTCQKCDKSYITKSHLNEHTVQGHGDKSLMCPTENYGYKTSIKSYLANHQKNIHIAEELQSEERRAEYLQS